MFTIYMMILIKFFLSFELQMDGEHIANYFNNFGVMLGINGTNVRSDSLLVQEFYPIILSPPKAHLLYLFCYFIFPLGKILELSNVFLLS